MYTDEECQIYIAIIYHQPNSFFSGLTYMKHTGLFSIPVSTIMPCLLVKSITLQIKMRHEKKGKHSNHQQQIFYTMI